MRDFHLPGRSATYAANGMCATSHPLAAKTAIDILERGGNAVDAAIAGAVLLGICEPQMTGIGGDCFVLFNTPGDQTVHALNGSGRAPAGASAAALRAEGHDVIPLRSAHAVTVPGAIDAFCQLSADHGKLGLDALLDPAILFPFLHFAARVRALLLKAPTRLIGGIAPHLTGIAAARRRA